MGKKPLSTKDIDKTINFRKQRGKIDDSVHLNIGHRPNDGIQLGRHRRST